MSRLLSIFVFVCVAASSPGGEVAPAEKKLTEFLSGLAMQNVTWKAYEGSGCTIYYATAQPPRRGAVGVYIGASPFTFEADERSTSLDGSLGRFPVKWVRRIEDGFIQTETVLCYAPHQYAHVLIQSPDEPELNRFVSEIGRLAIFAPVAVEKNFVGPGFVDSGLRSASLGPNTK
jgi:hypothetical protein